MFVLEELHFLFTNSMLLKNLTPLLILRYLQSCSNNLEKYQEMKQQVRRDQKTLISASALFLSTVAKILVLEGRLGTRVSSNKKAFSLFSNFVKSWSLKSFRNLSGNSHTKFFILDKKFRFTCGKSNLYRNFRKL